MQNEIEKNDQRVPTGFCETCRQKLKATANNSIPENVTFSNTVFISTNEIGECSCAICKIARVSGKGCHPVLGGPMDKKQRAKWLKSQKAEKTEMRVCTKCFSELKQGKKHLCQKSSTLEHLEKLTEKHEKAMEQHTSKFLKRKSSETAGPVELSQEHGKRMKVQVGIGMALSMYHYTFGKNQSQ